MTAIVPSLPLAGILYLFVAHFIGDFVLQSDRIALNKSKSWLILSEHVLLYSLPFMVYGWQFALLNAGLHFCVDAVTSRMTAFYWQRNERHCFFVVIGLDQTVHFICLVTTLYWLKML